jgi:CDP-diacylglycerol--serine O-phosphatidyltransferase
MTPVPPRRPQPLSMDDQIPPELRDDDRDNPYYVTQASRIYVLPNLMTAGNLFCGFIAIINCIQARLAETAGDHLYLERTAADHYRLAVYCIFGACVFDALDGRLARMGGRESLFGAEFDSLADVVSFGMAPALMMFFFILSPTAADPTGAGTDLSWFREIGWIVGFIYLLCAAMRLARFNVITNPLLHRGAKQSSKDFVGLPVPAAASTVAALMLFLLQLEDRNKPPTRWALALPFLMLLIALLMMSTVRYPSGKQLDLQTKTRTGPFIGILLVAVLVVYFKEDALLAVCLSYIFFGLVRHWRRPPLPPLHPK